MTEPRRPGRVLSLLDRRGGAPFPSEQLLAVVMLSLSEGSPFILTNENERRSEMFSFRSIRHGTNPPSRTRRVERDSVVAASNLEFPVKARWAGHTSKALDKYVVVRVILHGQCSLQRKEAI